MKIDQLLKKTTTSTTPVVCEGVSDGFMIYDDDMDLAKRYVEKLFRTNGSFVYGTDADGIVTVDCTGDLKLGNLPISAYDLFYGHESGKPVGFRVKFGRVNGDFSCSHYFTNGITLENGPEEVDGFVNLGHCNLVTTAHLPKKMNGSLTLDGNGHLTALEFVPQGLDGLYANECYALAQVNGKLPRIEDYDVQITDTKHLSSLEFLPDHIGGDLNLSGDFDGDQLSKLFTTLKSVGWSDTGNISFQAGVCIVRGAFNVSRIPMIANLSSVSLPRSNTRYASAQMTTLDEIVNSVLEDISSNGKSRRSAALSMQRALIDAGLADFLK